MRRTENGGAAAVSGSKASENETPVSSSPPLLVSSTSPVRLVKKHPLAIRWFHWVNFPVLFLMIWSGLLILWAYDKYPTEQIAFHVPNRVSFYQWGVAPVYGDMHSKDGKPIDADNYPRPPGQRFDIDTGFKLAQGQAIHFTLAWLFTLNGVGYVVFLIVSGQWRFLIPKKESFVEAFKVVLYDLKIWKKSLPPGKYNHAQRIAYSGVIFLGILMVVNGLAIYKPAQLAWLVALFGGYQTARLIHFIVTWLFLAFFGVHVTQVIAAGWNNFRGMITGHELQKAGGGH